MTKKDKQPQIGTLRYIGDGSALDDVPARDLSHDEVQALIHRIDEILASGLYEPTDAPPAAAESEA